MLDWAKCEAVESVADRRSGDWVFRGTRMPVATVFENLGDLSIEELMREYDVTREQLEAVMKFVIESLAGAERPAEPAANHAYSL